MTPPPNLPPRLSARWLSFCCYLGLAPLVKCRRTRSPDPFLHHHFAQAMAIFFLLQLWLGLSFMVSLGEHFILVRSPDLYLRLDKWEFYLACVLWLALAILALMWIALVVLALVGSTRALPLLQRQTRRPRVIRFAFISNSLALTLIPVLTAFALYTTSLTRTSHEGAAVYFLYDDGIPVPRWGYAMGMYRMTSQAERNWGKGCTVVDRLNPENLRTALAHGKVVILATHGDLGYAYAFNKPLPRVDVGTLCVGPPDAGITDKMNNAHFLQTYVLGANHRWSKAENVTVNNGLQLAYLFACHAGNKAAQWEEHLGPAQVVTYNRVSTILDHAYWFALVGPAKLKTLQ